MESSRTRVALIEIYAIKKCLDRVDAVESVCCRDQKARAGNLRQAAISPTGNPER